MATSIVFTINNTIGSGFTLAPGALNGPGGAQRNSDMRLYGMGALLWGEGMDENVLRLAESFACPAKQLNDYNPITELYDYDPNVDPLLPQDENDLGAGNGITVPIKGQVWYNTSADTLYVCTDPGSSGAPSWNSVGGGSVGPTPPVPAILGDLWYDTSGAGNGCNGEYQLKVYNPTHPSAISGWVLVAEDSVRKCGDIMSGNLDMDGNEILNLPATPSPTAATSKEYVDTEISNLASTSGLALTAHASDAGIHLTSWQNTYLDYLESVGQPAGTAGARVEEVIDGTVASDILARVKKSGDTMDLNANITFNGGQPLGLPATPSPTGASSKEYVDTTFVSKASIHVSSASPTAGDGAVGDVWYKV